MANWQHVNEPTRINDVRRETMTVSAAEFWNLLHYTSHCGQVASVRRGKRFVTFGEEMKGVEVDAANHVGQAQHSFYTEIYCLLVSFLFLQASQCFVCGNRKPIIRAALVLRSTKSVKTVTKTVPASK
jgi:hypothetical protein